MNKLSLLLCIQVISVAVALDYETRCPAAGEWRFRGGKLNCGSTKYVCLLHTARNTFHENCDGLDYSSIGSKLIFEPFFNKALCSYNRYQPFYFSTDGNSECVYQKSFCNERGQYVFYKGSLETDTTCGCDLSSGYEFVSKPKNTCYCIPSEEDCSCHKLPCYAKDEQCPLDDDVIKTKRKAKDNTLINLKEDISNNNRYVYTDGNKGRTPRQQCLYLTTALLCVLIIIGSICCLYGYIQERTAELQENFMAGFTENYEFIEDIEKRKNNIAELNNRLKTQQERMNFLDAIINGPEVRRFVKIFVHGKDGAVKSSLVNKLFAEKHSNTKFIKELRTVHRCFMNTRNGELIEIEDATEKQKKARRALKAVHHEKTGKELPKQEFTDLDTEISEIKRHLKDINIESESVSVKMISGGLIECGLLCCTGQGELNAIHQSFFTPNAIYLFVADMSDDIKIVNNSTGATIKDWFDSIHCLCDTDSTKNINGQQKLKPSIIMVFYNTDEYTKETFEDRKKILIIQLKKSFPITYRHVRMIFFWNTDDDEEFENVRLGISETTNELKHWRENSPFKWSHFEHLIEKNRSDKKNIITMAELAKDHDFCELEKKDLVSFLRFQHDKGNILFFEDMPELILLNPQYFINAFLCLVNNKMDSDSNNENLTQFKSYGLLTESLTTDIFNTKYGSELSLHTKSVLKIMETMDILVKIGDKSEYLIPSMMPNDTLDAVSRKLCVEQQNCKRTSWLCLKFSFLPPAFFVHLCAWFMQKYAPSKVECQNQSKALFRETCIFDIDENGSNKLLFTMSNNIIALQLLLFSKKNNESRNLCGNIYNGLKKAIVPIIRRYSVMEEYDLGFKCSTDNDFADVQLYKTLKKTWIYKCKQHKNPHLSKQLYSTWMSEDNSEW